MQRKTIINYNNNNKNRNRQRRRRRRRNIARQNPPQTTMRPIRLGVGHNYVNVNYSVTCQTTEAYVQSSGVFDVMSATVTSNEFTKSAADYQYFRVKAVKVTQPPLLLTLENTYGTKPTWIKFDWHSDSSQNVINDDNAKVLTVNNMRRRTYIWFPPNVISTVVPGLQPVNVNPYQWISTTSYPQVFPGWLKYTTVIRMPLEVSVLVEFKGNKTVVAQAAELKPRNVLETKNMLIEAFNKLKLEEENKANEQEDEDIDPWEADPKTDHKPRWSKQRKRLMKQIKELDKLQKEDKKEVNNNNNKGEEPSSD